MTPRQCLYFVSSWEHSVLFRPNNCRCGYFYYIASISEIWCQLFKAEPEIWTKNKNKIIIIDKKMCIDHMNLVNKHICGGKEGGLWLYMLSKAVKINMWSFLDFSGTNPNKHYIPLYRSLTAIWIVFGLAWLALVFNVGADLMEKFLQLKWHKPDLSLAEGDTTKLEDEPEQPRIHIPTWKRYTERSLERAPCILA